MRVSVIAGGAGICYGQDIGCENLFLMADFFNAPLADAESVLSAAVGGGFAHQRDQIELIALENIVLRAVQKAKATRWRVLSSARNIMLDIIADLELVPG